MTYKLHIVALVLVLFSVTNTSFAQTDSIVMSNENYMVGEIKSLSLGIIQIETDYSDSDFKIEWDKIKYLKSEQEFIVSLSGGGRYFGTIETDPDDISKVIINDEKEGRMSVKPEEIVFLKPVDDSFISRLDFDIALGFTLTKANNNQQFSLKAGAGYLTSKFSAGINFNRISSFQVAEDSIEIRTYRTELGVDLQFLLVKGLFFITGTDLLQSTEQKLKLRAVTKGGLGTYLVNTQAQYFIVAGGGAWNFENYDDPAIDDRNSFEAFVGLEYNIFDLGDLDLKTSVIAFPSITEKGRYRTDFNFDMSYDIIGDLFINLGFTLNYDNKPVAGASETDYVFQTTVGWEL